MKQKSGRRQVRERVMQTLYAYSMNNSGLEELTTSMSFDLETESDKKFFSDLVYKCINNADSYDEEISRRTLNWEIDRIAWVDRVLLRIGMCEFLNFADIPPKVTINELIDIAKEFSTEKSGKFINGILDKLLAELKVENRIFKTGRGLIDETIPKKNDE